LKKDGKNESGKQRMGAWEKPRLSISE